MLKNLFGDKKDDFQFVTPSPTKDTCPYCGFRFEKVPSRKKKCPKCENYIFVRFGELYTEEEKNINDLLDHFTMQELGVTRELFNKTRHKLSKEFGTVASINDTLWRILNHTAAHDKSYTHKKIAYQAMERILLSEGKNTDDVVAQVQKMELMEGKIANEDTAKAIKEKLVEHKSLIESSHIEMVVKIHTANDEHVCDECRRLSKEIYSVDEFLENMPIPYKCTNAKCRCWISFTLPDTD